MRIETVIGLLIFMFIAYCVMTYKKLITQNTKLDTLAVEIQTREDKHKNIDIKRRAYNAIVRDYNHTLTSFVGKILANKLNYEQREIIEKT